MGLTKVVDKTYVEISQGGSATFTYTVTATPGEVVETARRRGPASCRCTTRRRRRTDRRRDRHTHRRGLDVRADRRRQRHRVAGGATETFGYECEGAGHPSGTNTAKVSFDPTSRSPRPSPWCSPRGQTSVTRSWTSTTTRPTPTRPGAAGRGRRRGRPDGLHLPAVKSGTAGACTTYTNTAVQCSKRRRTRRHGYGRACVETPLAVDGVGFWQLRRRLPWTIEKDVIRTRVEVDAETGEATSTTR